MFFYYISFQVASSFTCSFIFVKVKLNILFIYLICPDGGAWWLPPVIQVSSPGTSLKPSSPTQRGFLFAVRHSTGRFSTTLTRTELNRVRSLRGNWMINTSKSFIVGVPVKIFSRVNSLGVMFLCLWHRLQQNWHFDGDDNKYIISVISPENMHYCWFSNIVSQSHYYTVNVKAILNFIIDNMHLRWCSWCL